jgi:hypothetical protein
MTKLGHEVEGCIYGYSTEPFDLSETDNDGPLGGILVDVHDTGFFRPFLFLSFGNPGEYRARK